MQCVQCGSHHLGKAGRDREGHQRHRCGISGRRQTERSTSAFAGYRFPNEIIALAVRWYLYVRLSFADVAELLAELGIYVDTSTIFDWVQRFTPLYQGVARPHRHRLRGKWSLDQDPNGATSVLYKFSPGGGVASATTVIGSNLPTYTFGLAFGSDGKLYASNLFDGTVRQLDTSTGSVLRVVANIGCFMQGIATDPLSGDLFVASSCGIERISNYSSGPGTVTVYTPSLQGVDGINFGPDGTLYAASVPAGNPNAGTPIAIAGTNTALPGSILQVYPALPCVDGIGVAISSPSSHSGFLLVNTNIGTITKVDTSTNPATLTNIFTGGSRGDFVVTGSDGCLYATQTGSHC
jgi:transposase-like protein/WD40 repeat protein